MGKVILSETKEPALWQQVEKGIMFYEKDYPDSFEIDYSDKKGSN